MASKKKKRIKVKPDRKQKTKDSIGIGRFAITYLFLMGCFFLLIGLKPIQNVIDLNGLYTQGVVILTSTMLKILSIPSTSVKDVRFEEIKEKNGIVQATFSPRRMSDLLLDLPVKVNSFTFLPFSFPD